MNRLAIWVIVGAVCLGMAPFGHAQQSGGPGKPSGRELPRLECKAVETYIAKIDAARSIAEKERREERYAEAQAELKAALKGRDDDALLALAADYAKYTEQVAAADSADSKLADIVDKRLKLRSALLERCENYTATRSE
ncbi:MAG: hypothetical protein HY913_16920 [Desulfomonile tiedjei]|nr:hypothetical protein [Desulfomonile tiedjei]